MMTVGTITQLTTDRGPFPKQIAALPPVRSEPLLADLVVVEELARLAPELNPSNYNHDDVCRLNTAMCELYEVVRKYRPEANNSGEGREPRKETHA